MKLLRSYPVLAFVLVVLSVVGINIAMDSVGLLLITGTLAAMSWFVTEGARGRSLPPWVSNLLVIAVALSAIVDVADNEHLHDIFSVVGRFCLWLTVIKLYERKQPRDHGNLLLLSLLLMLTGCLLSASMWFGVVLIAYVVLGLYVLLLFQLYAAFERRRIRPTASGAVASGLRPVSGPKLLSQFRGLTAGVGVSGVLLSGAVFLLFPRGVGHGMINGLIAPGVIRRTGFDAHVDLLTGDRITKSRRVVGSVQVFNQSDRPIRLEDPLYLRGAVFSAYDGQGHWATIHGRARDFVVEEDQRTHLSLHELSFTPPALRADCRLVGESHTLFAPYLPVAVASEVRSRVSFDPTNQLLTVPTESVAISHYRVWFVPQPRESDAYNVLYSPQSSRPDRERNLRLNGLSPDDRRQVYELARGVLADAGLFPPPDEYDYGWSRRAAEALEAHLRTTAYRYDLDTSDIRLRNLTDDPLMRFLFDARKGHCEFFASALVVMCRSVGVEARLVAGYITARYDESNQHYPLIEANAHAWVEVRTGRYVWSTFDPTRSVDLAPMTTEDETIAGRLNRAYQNWEGSWSSGVVHFDRGTQLRLARALDPGWRDRAQAAWSSLRNMAYRFNRAFHFGPAGYVYLGFVGVVFIIAMMALVTMVRRRRAVRRSLHVRHLKGAEPVRMVRQLGFYLDMLTVLQRAGLSKPEWQPPLAFARVLQHERPDVAGIVRDITDHFYIARYGRSRLSSDEIGRIRSQVRRLANLLGVRQ